MLNLEGRLVLVVGGGRVARRKIGTLLEAGALVRLVSPRVDPELADLARKGLVEWLSRDYDSIDLEGCWLVIAATDDRAVNRRVGEEAGRAGVWANVADRPEAGGFTVPAHFRQGELVIAVSTGGASPLLAAEIKDDLARKFDSTWAEYCDLLAGLRAVVLEAGQSSEENRRVFKAALEADLLTPLRNGDRRELGDRLKKTTGFTLKDLEADRE